MSDLSVPTVAVAAEVLCADGRSFSGRIFIPVLSARHTGPMRAEEWLNDPAAFFPFLPDDEQRPVLMNKREVLVLSVVAPGEGPDDLPALPHQRVTLECEEHRIPGEIVIDMPEHRMRVLDYLNRSEPFLTLHDGGRHHLIQKSRITRVIETTET